ncbi:chitinase-3-like protein 2 [Prorops nasuta]|uniref:chitinase-3-like protein 2 n=1 Tax=Prorops nasuta TaxID=863751 RepID=UPI0034CD9CB8
MYTLLRAACYVTVDSLSRKILLNWLIKILFVNTKLAFLTNFNFKSLNKKAKQISSQSNYDILNKIRHHCWKVQVIFLLLLFLFIIALFVAYIWFGTVDFENSGKKLLGQYAQTSSWLCRTCIYAKSTKENQDADRDSSFTSSNNDSQSSGQIIVCYYSISGDLNKTQELSPSHIDPHLCTHIIVGFASVVNCTLNLGNNSWVYGAISDLKHSRPKLKVMVSVGGMNELHHGFPEMVRNHANRKKFIQSVLNATKIYSLDGLDLDWEFPAWASTEKRQKIHFVQLVQELRKEFDRSGQKLLLSAAVAAQQAIIDQSYNVPEIAKHIDFVNLMSYDYHFYIWYYPVTDFNSPLYSRSTETGYLTTLNMNFSANYWVIKGMPKEKIVVGIPTYGHTYKLVNPSNHDLLAPAEGYGELGNLGFVPYGNICGFIKGGAVSVFNNESWVPFAFKDTEWISYDDEISVFIKASWIKENNFKGAMVYSLNSDDWSYTCNLTEAFPLTRMIFSVFNKTSSN